jgi:hypothetical protein
MARSQLWTPPGIRIMMRRICKACRNTTDDDPDNRGGGQLKMPNIGVATKYIRAPDHPSYDDARVFYIHAPPPPHHILGITLAPDLLLFPHISLFLISLFYSVPLSLLTPNPPPHWLGAEVCGCMRRNRAATSVTKKTIYAADGCE